MLVDVWNFAVSEIGLAEGRIWFSAFRHFWYNNSGAGGGHGVTPELEMSAGTWCMGESAASGLFLSWNGTTGD